MSQINWLTPAGQILSVCEGVYTEFQLDAYDTSGSALKFKLISGEIGFGLQLLPNGKIQGVPIIEHKALVKTYINTFTIRATNQKNKISDRTFSIAVSSDQRQLIYPRDVSIGDYYDGARVSHQFDAYILDPSATLQWSIIDGEIPTGLALSQDGLLSGNIYPLKDSYLDYLLGWSMSRWDAIGWDAESSKDISKTFYFTVQVYDGVRYDTAKYSITVVAKQSFSSDNTIITSDNEDFLTNIDAKHNPIITTVPEDLHPIRQGSNLAFKIEGHDFDGDLLSYSLPVGSAVYFDQGPTDSAPLMPLVRFDESGFDQPDISVPEGITLDTTTGWLSGTLATQSELIKTYTFKVYCYKTEFPTCISDMVEFTLTIYGDQYNTIVWTTNANLGTIDNGVPSELSVSAVSTKGYQLFYKIKSGSESRLPQGMKLTTDGLLIGRPTFEYFSLDGGITAINDTTFDRTYSFVVQSYNAGATVIAEKTFTVTVSNYNTTPFENLYMRAMPTEAVDFWTTIGRSELFPTELLYRANDPNFGKATDIRFLVAAGLTPSEVSEYLDNMNKNHYPRRIDLGNIKTAIATDDNFDVKYEVVYIDVSDYYTCNGKSAPNSIDLTGKLQSKYQVLPYKTLYPNSLDNMKSEVTGVGYANRGAIPKWMLSQQEDGTILGFKYAIVLAYTVPGASKLIAYRLKNNEYAFNEFANTEFIVDRYYLDNYLTTNFDLTTNKFIASKETTFDRLPAAGNVYNYAGAVDVAVTVPFDEINGKTLSYIKMHGGLDGVKDIFTGQRLVFAKQERFTRYQTIKIIDDFDEGMFDYAEFDQSHSLADLSELVNDGWNRLLNRYGNTVDTNHDGAEDNNAGYGMLPYSYSTPINGYLEKVVTPSVVNERAGIWEVSINDDDIVTLTMVQEIFINDFVQVGGGFSYGHTKIYYDPIVKPFNTVPEYSIMDKDVTIKLRGTYFDGNGTRFLNNRDQYAPPRTDEKQIRFPKNGCFS